MILLTVIMAIFFTLISPYLVEDSNTSDWKKCLCRKWYFSHCCYVWKDYSAEKRSKNDFILFLKNMTYESVDKGEKITGKWSLNIQERYITIYKENEKIKLRIEKLNDKELVFEIEDKELDGLELYYLANKRKGFLSLVPPNRVKK